MADGGVQLGTAGADRAHSLAVGQVEVPRETGDPTGDLPHAGRPGSGDSAASEAASTRRNGRK